MTFVGAWRTLHAEGIAKLAAGEDARSIDILASYRVGEIRRVLGGGFRQRQDASLRACFANMWDRELAEAYRRKYFDRTPEYMQRALQESIEGLLGPCTVEAKREDDIKVSNVSNAPAASYEIRLTSQRITFGYYRIDDVAFIVPMDIKKAQDPPPLAWVLDRETAPRAFEFYLNEFSRMFEEALPVYPGR